VLSATALVAAIGSGETFGRSRDLAAWRGLLPRQATTSGKPKLLGITKRGSKCLRKLLIQGARAAMPSLSRTATPLGNWTPLNTFQAQIPGQGNSKACGARGAVSERFFMGVQLVQDGFKVTLLYWSHASRKLQAVASRFYALNAYLDDLARR
jgi:hypothetical protein